MATLIEKNACPGAGSCVDWCYSLRAWRNPQAFFRQLQNTLLMLHCRRAIARAVTAAGVASR